jgi:hypothetical protein
MLSNWIDLQLSWVLLECTPQEYNSTCRNAAWLQSFRGIKQASTSLSRRTNGKNWAGRGTSVLSYPIGRSRNFCHGTGKWTERWVYTLNSLQPDTWFKIEVLIWYTQEQDFHWTRVEACYTCLWDEMWATGTLYRRWWAKLRTRHSLQNDAYIPSNPILSAHINSWCFSSAMSSILSPAVQQVYPSETLIVAS